MSTVNSHFSKPNSNRRSLSLNDENRSIASLSTHRNQELLDPYEKVPGRADLTVRLSQIDLSTPPAQLQLLNSWKEIALYVGRGVRTVQRWESDLGLPVHRPRGKNRSAVMAFRQELDDWLHRTPRSPSVDGNNKDTRKALLEIARTLQALCTKMINNVDRQMRPETKRLADAAGAIVDELTLRADGKVGRRYSHMSPSLEME